MYVPLMLSVSTYSTVFILTASLFQYSFTSGHSAAELFTGIPRDPVIMDVDDSVQPLTDALAHNTEGIRPSRHVEGAIVPDGTPTGSSGTDTSGRIADLIARNSYTEEVRQTKRSLVR